MKTISAVSLVCCLVLLWACNPSQPSLEPDPVAQQAAKKSGVTNPASAFTTFTVRIENVSAPGMVLSSFFSPGVWIVQKKNSAPLFVEGMPDFGDGLEGIAEDGSPAMLDASLENHPKVRSKGVFSVPVGAMGPAPIFTGDAYEFQVTAKNGDYLNFATMFIQSNDLFIGPDAAGIPLFTGNKQPISGDVTALVSLWDAGTEVNEAPGIGPNQAPRQSGPNTGPDENGVVQLVNDGYTYPNLTDIIQITVTPL